MLDYWMEVLWTMFHPRKALERYMEALEELVLISIENKEIGEALE